MVECTHRNQIKVTSTNKHICEDCVKKGDKWVKLRMCMTCGYVGCCDSSKNQHARKHFEKTGHPIIKSAEPGEDWEWCYIDKAYIKK